MSKYLSILTLLFLSFSLFAQNDRRQDNARRDLDYYSEDNPSLVDERFADNLWFGGGVQLNFQANQGVSLFTVGLSPMVGYKITPTFSIGPRVSVNYNAFRCEFNDIRSNYFTWEAGLFGRAKLFQQFFIHGEYSLENRRLIISCDEPLRQTRGMPYLGAGYTSGFEGAVGSEILILFRLQNDGQAIIESPYVFRAALNFNF